MIKKIATAAATLALLAATTIPAFADNSNHNFESENHGDHGNGGLHLDWKKEVNAKKCNVHGDPIINVEEKVKNDADSGVAGNAWAFDNYKRLIKVWQVGNNTYCATVAYEGKFNAVAGQTGPAGTGVIGNDVKGEFQGGYRSTVFTGTLLTSPLWPTNGSVGTVDYQCDLSFNCPGRINWTTQYFSSTPGFDLAWWGWIYKADDDHGTWINAISGNLGNIL